jgi:hypothetical protein
MAFNEKQIRYFWRTKYPWFFVLYILVIGLLRGVIAKIDNASFGLDLLMLAAFTSYVFLYIFYLFGVRPIELEHHFHKRK